jgi:hypothetical protein
MSEFVIFIAKWTTTYVREKYKQKALSPVYVNCGDLNLSFYVLPVMFGGGAYQHCSHEGLLYSNPPFEFRHSSPEALHTKWRERPLLAKDGTKAKEFS